MRPTTPLAVENGVRNLSILAWMFPGSSVVCSSLKKKMPETLSRGMLEKRAVAHTPIRYFGVGSWRFWRSGRRA
jgi:hypothetical protein